MKEILGSVMDRPAAEASPAVPSAVQQQQERMGRIAAKLAHPARRDRREQRRAAREAVEAERAADFADYEARAADMTPFAGTQEAERFAAQHYRHVKDPHEIHTALSAETKGAAAEKAAQKWDFFSDRLRELREMGPPPGVTEAEYGTAKGSQNDMEKLWNRYYTQRADEAIAQAIAEREAARKQPPTPEPAEPPVVDTPEPGKGSDGADEASDPHDGSDQEMRWIDGVWHYGTQEELDAAEAAAAAAKETDSADLQDDADNDGQPDDSKDDDSDAAPVDTDDNPRDPAEDSEPRWWRHYDPSEDGDLTPYSAIRWDPADPDATIVLPLVRDSHNPDLDGDDSGLPFSLEVSRREGERPPLPADPYDPGRDLAPADPDAARWHGNPDPTQPYDAGRPVGDSADARPLTIRGSNLGKPEEPRPRSMTRPLKVLSLIRGRKEKKQGHGTGNNHDDGLLSPARRRRGLARLIPTRGSRNPRSTSTDSGRWADYDELMGGKRVISPDDRDVDDFFDF